MNQQPLENIFTSPQMQASHASGLISVSETSFQQLPTMAQQLLPMLPSYPPPVAIYRLLRFGLALPTTSATIWFRDIASNFCFRQALQGVVTVISLIGHYLSWPFRLYLLTYFLVVSDAGDFGNVFPRLRQGFQNRLRVARSAAGHGYGHHRSRLEIYRMLGFVRQVGAPVFHFRDLRLGIVRIHPFVVRSLLGTLAVQLRQILPRRRSDSRFLRQPPQKLFIAFVAVTPHNRTHGRVRLQRRGIDPYRVSLQQPFLGQPLQYPTKYCLMRLHIDQPPRARDRRVIRRHLIQPHAQKTPQGQRVCRPPSQSPLAVDSFEIADQQQAKIPSRRQRRSSHLFRIKRRTALLDEIIKATLFQHPVQSCIKRMCDCLWQFALCNPHPFLSLLFLSSSHCHTRSVRTYAVDPAPISVQESRLSPRTASRHSGHGCFSQHGTYRPGGQSCGPPFFGSLPVVHTRFRGSKPCGGAEHDDRQSTLVHHEQIAR